MHFQNLFFDYNFEYEFDSVRKKDCAFKSLYHGRFSYFFSYPGRHSFVVLPRATNISPIQG